MIRQTCLTRGQSVNQLNDLIARYAARFGVDTNFVRAIAMVESCFNPDVGRSTANAVGPMQVLPSTAAQMNNDPSSPAEVRQASVYTLEGNVILGVYYLSLQLARFGDLWQAAGAYNCGPGCMNSAVSRGGASGYLQYLPAETRAYIPLVQEYYAALGGFTPTPTSDTVPDEMSMFGGIGDVFSGLIDKIQSATGLDRGIVTVGLVLSGLLVLTLFLPRR